MGTPKKRAGLLHMNRNDLKAAPAYSLKGCGTILVTDGRKPAWALIELDEYEQLLIAAGKGEQRHERAAQEG